MPALTEEELAADTVRRLGKPSELFINRDGTVRVHQIGEGAGRGPTWWFNDADMVLTEDTVPGHLLVEKNRLGRNGRHARVEVEAIVRALFSHIPALYQPVLEKISLEFPE